MSKKNGFKVIILLLIFSLNVSVAPKLIWNNNTINIVYAANKEECTEVRKEDDFYEAINKEWFDKIKLDKSCVSYGTFQEVSNKITDDVKEMIQDIKNNINKYDDNSEELKVVTLYDNYLDIDMRNELGIKPIKKYINQVNMVQDEQGVRNLLRDKEFSYFQFLINLGIGADCKDSSKNILYIGNSRLGLGNSHYYKNNILKDVYLDYITKLNLLSGLDSENAIKDAEVFYEIERKIADKIPTREEEALEEDRIEKSYNVYTIKELDKAYPSIEFSKLLKEYKLNKAKKIVVENPKVLNVVNDLINKNNVNDMKIYFRTSILLRTDNLLTEEFRGASSDLKKKLYGGEVANLNENNAVRFAMCQLEDIISKLYVDKHFDYECKKDVENMANEIIKNFKKRLEKNDWMSDDTKKEAIKKLKKLDVKIGYPNKWDDYSTLEINSYDNNGNLVDNLICIYNFEMNKGFSNINKSVDKDKWSMGACTVNAYYNPINNEIVFPAGILQAPFYDKYAIKEKNLGGIGVVIGHELTHAFDNIGSQFDENGRLKNWWCEKDYKEFSERSKQIINYYSNISMDNGKHINGELTVGENISDLGGMACIIDIANNLENPNYKELFENYAKIWREASTEEMKEFLLKNDCHAPKKVRVNEVLSQFDEFYKTYNINEEDKMYVKPENRIGIW